MKTTILTLLLAASAVLVGCSSNQVQPHRPVSGVPGKTSAPTSSAPSSAQSAQTAGASDACAKLAGTPVGTEVGATTSSTGKLAAPPTACSTTAETSGSGRCAPAGKSAGNDHWFYFTSDGHTALGRTGGTWHVKQGAFDKSADLETIGC
jgi:hypothetical protein